jgi:hypothetical protein
MGMNKPESSQCLFSKRIILKGGYDDSFCITNNHMGNRTVSGNENSYLSVNFRREFNEVSCKLRGNYLTMYFSPVNSLEGVKIAGLEP